MDEQENLIKFGYTPKMLWCAHFYVKGPNFVNSSSCEMHLLKLPITLKCKMKTKLLTHTHTQQQPLNK
jgi:hypothetical protein